MELSQSRQEQNEYLRNVELKRVLDKRAERKRKREEETDKPINSDDKLAASTSITESSEHRPDRTSKNVKSKKSRIEGPSIDNNGQLDSVLSSIF